MACQVNMPWLPVSIMFSGLLMQNNPQAASPAEEADSFPVLWAHITPLASSDSCLQPELPSVGIVIQTSGLFSLKIVAPF